jgi:hypothetical protein
MSSEEFGDALDGPPRRGDRELLTGYLEEKRPEQVHGRKFVQPRVGIEVWPALYQISDHGVYLAKVALSDA